ncbi:hypothetical protein BJ322DRAFT_1103066 [Thelephora terrestris]|uniref:REJ domain-containing protein n=1 Tax=Thelephora terrestris TaxID=56493 RepID=A0A9P6HQI7_9AGAM|nr:hypothetical protein BJ322DRAFT_1103066 [Thelephora terrestris]
MTLSSSIPNLSSFSSSEPPSMTLSISITNPSSFNSSPPRSFTSPTITPTSFSNLPSTSLNSLPSSTPSLPPTLSPSSMLRSSSGNPNSSPPLTSPSQPPDSSSVSPNLSPSSLISNPPLTITSLVVLTPSSSPAPGSTVTVTLVDSSTNSQPSPSSPLLFQTLPTALIAISTLDSTVYITTTNNEGSTITVAPSYITSTVVYTNTRGQQVTVTEILSNPSLLPDGHGGGASAFFHMKGAVIAVFTAVGLVIVAGLWLLFWYLRSRHKRRKIEHDNIVAAILDGRRDSVRLSLIDDDEDYSGNIRPSLTDHSYSDPASSSHGRTSPFDSAGQMAPKNRFPPVSLLAASYNQRKRSSSQGNRGSGGQYQHLRARSDGAGRSPSPPPRFSQEYYRGPFSDAPAVPVLLGTRGDNIPAPLPAIMDEFDPEPLSLTAPISPDRARRELYAQRKELGADNPASSNESLHTGVSTRKDWEVRNVFDEELGSVPQMRRKPMLSVQNPSSVTGSSPAPSVR